LGKSRGGGLAQEERQRGRTRGRIEGVGRWGIPVEAVFRGEAARGGEGRGSDGQEARWREVAWGEWRWRHCSSTAMAEDLVPCAG
jgi:hypothetical protein